MHNRVADGFREAWVRAKQHAKEHHSAAVAKLTKPGRYAVGDGAYLQIAGGGTKVRPSATSATARRGIWASGR